MVQISKRKLSKQKLEHLFVMLFKVVASRKGEVELRRLFEHLFSDTERIMIVKRLAIVYLLLKGITQQNISMVLNVSPATVAKFSLLVEHTPEVKKFYTGIPFEDRIVDSFERLFDALFPPGTYGTNWKAGWDRKQSIRNRKEYGL